MKKIVALAGSTSSTSINKQLITYSASLIDNCELTILDMREYDSIMYSIDEEKNGFPDQLKKLSEDLKSYDGFIISLAEHNGSYTAAFKNILDWLSRIEREVFNQKPMLLMSASPGGRGGASVQEAAQSYFPRLGANIITTFLFPKFYENFTDGKIINLELNKVLKDKIEEFTLKL